MSRFLFLAALFAFLWAPLARAADFPQRWCYAGLDLSKDAGVDKFIDLLKQCKAIGITHVTVRDGYSAFPEYAPAQYPARVKRVIEAAKQNDITLCLQVYAIGYGGLYFHDDANLAAGIPARNEPFIVNDGVASPDPDAIPKLVNGNFNDVKDGKPAGWQAAAPAQEPCISADASVLHGDSGASLKISDFDKLPKTKATVEVRAVQVIDGVKPFQYYRLSVWIKSDKCHSDPEQVVQISSSNGNRRNSWKNIHVPDTSDWTKYEITFNTFEVPDGKLRIALGVNEFNGGSMWFDDLKIEPAGMLLILRRPIKPLVVTSEDGATTYTEGKDFEPVSDSVISEKPFSGEFTIDHDAPKIVLTKDSAIRQGQRLSVSFFHFMRIYDDQDVISLQDPGTLELMDKQVKQVAKLWASDDIFMGYDEVRVCGWEVQPDGQHLTPGQILAKNTKEGYDIIKKYRPNATVYAWSDMYSPYHNARPFDAPGEQPGYYYLCNGTWDGSWEGLPKDVVIFNWFSDSEKGTKLFGDRGQKQILCGFYDAKETKQMEENISNWMKVSQGVPNVIGMMYTTWSSNYEQMPEYFRLVKEYPNFKEP